jgi:hypothetical protein
VDRDSFAKYSLRGFICSASYTEGEGSQQKVSVYLGLVWESSRSAAAEEGARMITFENAEIDTAIDALLETGQP